jgi:hypothetical protein
MIFLRVHWYRAGRVMKWLTVALLIFSVFTPTVFAQTVEQKEFPGCVEIISGTETHLQCDNVVTPTVEQTGGTVRARRLTPEQRKARVTERSKAAAKARPVYSLEVLPGRQIRDFEDSPEGPIISVAR